MICTGKNGEVMVDHNSNPPIHVAISEISGHVEVIWTFVWYLYHQLHFMHGQIYHSFPKSSVWPSAATYDKSSIGNGDHLGNWRPNWNYLNIWIVLITLTVHLACISGELIVAIFENGGHFKTLLGQLLEGWPMQRICAKSGNSIMIQTIFTVICSANLTERTIKSCLVFRLSFVCGYQN